MPQPRPPDGYSSTEYFTITPMPELTKLLQTLEAPGPELNDAARKILDRLHSVIRAYPAPKPSYQRTYKLQNSWQMTSGAIGDELGKVISGGPDYNVYVKDEEWQSDVHAGRHRTTVQVAEDQAIAAFALEVLEEAFQALINKVP